GLFGLLGMKARRNGNLLIMYADQVREVDLAGNTIFALPRVQLQTSLNAVGLSNPPLTSLHHDILKLANGHYILLANIARTDIPWQPSVTGHVIVDWDPKKGAAVWTWNAFDHLDVARAPQGADDWTHGNALVYSPDDGNLLFSMRNQNWIIKINYADGAGDGSVLWRLGADGDF